MEDLIEGIAKPIRQEIMIRSYATTQTGELFDMKVAAIKANEIADQILTYLKSQGMVKLAENQDWKIGDPIDKANFKRVEEL